MERLAERLGASDLVIIDGGMGSELQARGVAMDRAAWSARANLERPDMVQQIHEDYISAGAEVLIANTYAASRLLLRGAGLEDRFVEVNKRAVDAAMAAREATGAADVVIAGSISLGVAVDFMSGASTSEFDGAELEDLFAEQAELLKDSGVDLLALEMIMAASYGVSAVDAALDTGLPVWLGVSAELTRNGRVVALEDETTTLDDLLDALVRPSLQAVNVMHSAVAATGPALEVVARHFTGARGAYPESGDWVPPTWVFSDVSPDALVASAAAWVDSGAQIVGGCCGTGPAFIEALREIRPTGGAGAL